MRRDHCQYARMTPHPPNQSSTAPSYPFIPHKHTHTHIHFAFDHESFHNTHTHTYITKQPRLMIRSFTGRAFFLYTFIFLNSFFLAFPMFLLWLILLCRTRIYTFCRLLTPRRYQNILFFDDDITTDFLFFFLSLSLFIYLKRLTGARVRASSISVCGACCHFAVDVESGLSNGLIKSTRVVGNKCLTIVISYINARSLCWGALRGLMLFSHFQ